MTARKSEIEEPADDIGINDGHESHLIKSISLSARRDRARGNDVREQLEIYRKVIELQLALFEAHALSNELPSGAEYSALVKLSASTDGGLKKIVDEANCEINLLIKELLELEYSLAGLNDKLSSVIRVRKLENPPKTPEKDSDLDQRVECVDNIVEEWLADCIRRAWEESVISRLGASSLGLTSIKGDTYTLIKQSLSADLDHLIRATKFHKSKIRVIGSTESEVCTSAVADQSEGFQEILPNTYDDTITYNQLIRSLLDVQKYVATGSSYTDLVNLSKQLQNKVKRMDAGSRASKEKRIKFFIHDKIANFMAPRPRPRCRLESEAISSLLDSLFSV